MQVSVHARVGLIHSVDVLVTKAEYMSLSLTIVQ